MPVLKCSFISYCLKKRFLTNVVSNIIPVIDGIIQLLKIGNDESQSECGHGRSDFEMIPNGIGFTSSENLKSRY